MKKKAKELLERLKTNHCNISDALEYTEGASLQDFYEFMKDEDFKTEYNVAIQIRDDKAYEVFMDLILAGDRSAVIEFQKMKRQTDTIEDKKRIRVEVMRVLIQLANTKGACLKEFCEIFGATKHQSEKAFDDAVVLYNLKTPHQRQKAERENQEERMSEMLANNDLTELEMYSRMLSKALDDSEISEYPSERSRARDDVIKINQRLDEINDRQRREEEDDDINLIDGFDSLASGLKPSEIQEYRDKLAQETLAITDAEH